MRRLSGKGLRSAGVFLQQLPRTKLCPGPRGPDECGSVTPSRRLGQARTRAHSGSRPLYRCQHRADRSEDVRTVALE